MAYFWEDKIADCVYTNPELDTVKILWKDENDIYREHYLAVDEEDEQFQALLEVTSYEDIETRTKTANDIVRQEFKDAFDRYAERTGLYTGAGDDPAAKDAELFRFFSNFDYESAEHKERLFSLKLSVFEQNVVKDADTSDNSKKTKTAIRKSTDPIQILSLLQSFRNEKSEIKTDDEGNVIGVYVSFE